MKIITRGKRISKYSKVSGLMTVDVTNDIFWLKMDFDSGSGQIIVELSEFEVAQIINVGLKDAKIVAACKRQKHPLIKGFLE
jgi:hypothetical protein